jgi:hypothetical protein
MFSGKAPKPQYLEAFEAFLKRHPNVPMIWAHFMGNSRGVQPYPEHWKYLDQMLSDPAFRHVYIDLSWGPIIAPYIIDTPEHLKMLWISSANILTASFAAATRALPRTGSW